MLNSCVRCSRALFSRAGHISRFKVLAQNSHNLCYHKTSLQALSVRFLSVDQIFNKSPQAIETLKEIPTPPNVSSQFAHTTEQMLSANVDISMRELVPDLVNSWTMIGLDKVQGVTPWQILLEYVESLHALLGTSWAPIIIGSAFVLKIAFVNHTILAQKNRAFAEYYKLEAQEYQRCLDAAETEEEQTHWMNAITQLGVISNQHCSFFYPIKLLFLYSLLTQTVILKELAFHLYSGMSTESFLWLNSLSFPDPIYALPLLTAVSFYISKKTIYSTCYCQPIKGISNHVILLMPASFMFLALCNAPAAIQLFWCTSSFISVFYNQVLRITEIRDHFGIPKPQSSSLQSQEYDERTFAARSFEGRQEDLQKEESILMDKAESDFVRYIERRNLTNINEVLAGQSKEQEENDRNEEELARKPVKKEGLSPDQLS
ncbi:60Kd inner membrane protein [Ditylenchus destructor]|nr:60Kd inner membrane protein [Ditylenchus destructor]